jgi:hypothetical protein
MKVGEYIRTNEGIRKIEKIYKYDVLTDISFNEYSSNLNDRKDLENQIIKSSPNIIDLIEENDIVNHSRVVCIGVSTDLNGIHKYLVLENRGNCANGNIKSIITHEQVESMEYKVGD